MIRPTVARVDLAAIERNYARSLPFLSRSPDPRRRDRPADHRRRQGQRLRPRRRARSGSRSSGPARRCSPAPTSRKASCCARAGVADPDPRLRRAQRQRSRRRVRVRPHADDLDAVRRAARCGCRGEVRPVSGRRQTGIDRSQAPLPPEDRHRHEPARLPPRQPRADAAGDRGKSEYLAIDAVYTHFATADDPEHPAFGEQRDRFEQVAGHAAVARHHARRTATPPTAPRCCATSASGTTSSAPACSSTASSRRRSRRLLALRPALSLHSRIVHVKGMRPGEGTGLRPALARPTGPPPSPSCRPATPTASIARLAGRGLHARPRPPRPDRRLGVHGHDDDRRHRRWTCRPATKW